MKTKHVHNFRIAWIWFDFYDNGFWNGAVKKRERGSVEEQFYIAQSQPHIIENEMHSRNLIHFTGKLYPISVSAFDRAWRNSRVQHIALLIIFMAFQIKFIATGFVSVSFTENCHFLWPEIQVKSFKDFYSLDFLFFHQSVLFPTFIYPEFPFGKGKSFCKCFATLSLPFCATNETKYHKCH